MWSRWDSRCAVGSADNPHNWTIYYKEKRESLSSFFFCGVDGTRTHYLLIANQMLYQMSYYPDLL